MQTLILRKILAGILASWLAGAPTVPVKLGATNPIPQAIGRFETTLASRISSSETSTATLVSGTTAAGNTLNGVYGFCIDCENSKWEYIVASASGTALSSITRGVSPDDGITSVPALQKEHLRGASVKITDAPSLPYIRNIVSGSSSLPSPIYYQTAISNPSSTALISRSWLDATSTDFVRLTGNQTIGGSKTFSLFPYISASTPTQSGHVATKGYVDGVAIAGGASSSATVYGISKLSTSPANANLPIAVGDNDTRLSNYIGSFGTVASSSVTTTVVGGYNMLLFYNGRMCACGGGAAARYLCYKRSDNSTSVISYQEGSEGDNTSCFPTTISGFYSSPTSSNETVTFQVFTDSNCVAPAGTSDNNRRIIYLQLK